MAAFGEKCMEVGTTHEYHFFLQNSYASRVAWLLWLSRIRRIGLSYDGLTSIAECFSQRTYICSFVQTFFVPSITDLCGASFPNCFEVLPLVNMNMGGMNCPAELIAQLTVVFFPLSHEDREPSLSFPFGANTFSGTWKGAKHFILISRDLFKSHIFKLKGIWHKIIHTCTVEMPVSSILKTWSASKW